jgi:hypothetical protein
MERLFNKTMTMKVVIIGCSESRKLVKAVRAVCGEEVDILIVENAHDIPLKATPPNLSLSLEEIGKLNQVETLPKFTHKSKYHS